MRGIRAGAVFRTLAIVSAFALVAVACGDDNGGGGGGDGGGGDENVIRFTFAPDPVWDYLKDSGISAQMQEESGITIIEQTSWDEFGLYAGGHADIVSIASFEVPLLEEETGVPATVFGKYNIDRSILVVPADSDAQTLEDLKGEKIAVWDAVSSTVVWGALARDMYDLDFRTGGGDFELVLADLTNTGALAANKEVAGALVLPDFNVPPLLNGDVRVLYDGKTAADLYAEAVDAPDGYEGPMINIFMAPTEWYDSHPEEVAFFLEVWEAGIAAWQADQDTIIESYPQHFAVETDEEIQFMKDYLAAHDWFVETVYLDDAWVETESKIFPMLADAGLSESDEAPRFDVVPAP
jgi:ABC-type nitrate/sulfonate/bicarbonate transport system substrate-binding protein